MANVSEGSTVTYLRCGEIISDDFITNLVTVLKKQSPFGELTGNCKRGSDLNGLAVFFL